MTESHLVFKVFTLLLFAAITTATVVLLLWRCFAPKASFCEAIRIAKGAEVGFATKKLRRSNVR
jgi:hypothetical protein